MGKKDKCLPRAETLECLASNITKGAYYPFLKSSDALRYDFPCNPCDTNVSIPESLLDTMYDDARKIYDSNKFPLLKDDDKLKSHMTKYPEWKKMLTAVLDSLADGEVAELVRVLTRDGFVCLSSTLPIDELHQQLSEYVDKPVVVYGEASVNLPLDDCPRLWIGCGPEGGIPACDEQAAARLVPVEALNGHLERRALALRLGYQLVSFVEALSFMANVMAKKRVSAMGLESKAADIVLRHVRRTTYL